MPPPNLDNLPVELIHHIASLLPTLPSVIALRSTSRDLCAKVTSSDPFRAAFSTRTADISDASLTTLAAVAAHPSFGRLIRTVVLRTCLFDPHTLHSQILRHDRKRADGGGGGRRPLVDCTDDDDDIAAARRTAQLYQERNDGMRRLRESGRDAELITAFFESTKTRRLKVVLEAAVFDGAGARVPAWTVKKIYGLSDGGAAGEKARLWRAMAHDVGVVLAAVVRAQARVEELHLYGGGDAWGGSVMAAGVGDAIDAAAAAAASWNRPALEAVLSRVKVLSGSMTFGKLPPHAPDGRRPRGGFADRFGEFLAMAKGLEVLDLLHHATSTPEDDTLQAMFRKTFAPIAGERVRSLRLRGFSASTADVVELIGKCANLQELELHEFTLEDGEWSKVFDLLREQSRKLQRLTVCRLYERHQPIIITGPEDCELPQDEEEGEPPDQCVYQMNGEQVGSGIEYRLDTDRPRGSPSVFIYRLKFRHIYRY